MRAALDEWLQSCRKCQTVTLNHWMDSTWIHHTHCVSVRGLWSHNGPIMCVCPSIRPNDLVFAVSAGSLGCEVFWVLGHYNGKFHVTQLICECVCVCVCANFCTTEEDYKKGYLMKMFVQEQDQQNEKDENLSHWLFDVRQSVELCGFSCENGQHE